jgi:hypothetical protein
MKWAEHLLAPKLLIRAAQANSLRCSHTSDDIQLAPLTPWQLLAPRLSFGAQSAYLRSVGIKVEVQHHAQRESHWKLPTNLALSEESAALRLNEIPTILLEGLTTEIAFTSGYCKSCSRR